MSSGGGSRHDSTRRHASSPRMSLLHHLADGEERVGNLETMALRTASLPMRDVFAAMATNRTWTYAQLRSWLHQQPGRTRPTGGGEPGLVCEWAARLAHVVALQSCMPDDLETALRLYWVVHDRADLSNIASEHAGTFCDLLLWAGEDIFLEELLPGLRIPASEEQRIRTDLENPHRNGPRAKPERTWRRRLAEVARFPADMTLGPTCGARPFDQLHAKAGPGTRPRAGRLVTVIINVHRPDSALHAAVRSILDQTWDELEVIIVDDGSGEEFAVLFDEVAALDERVRLITLEENIGAYAARNVALDRARGTYVTFQDYDDWSVPQRLALQVEPLESDRGLVATRARAASFSEDLTLRHPGYDDRFLQTAAATLLFRRAQVMQGIGYFDDVRKGADNEYHKRMVARFGRGSSLELPSASPSLMAMRRRAGSLSRDEFRPGWWHPDRAAYRSSYKYWHEIAPRHALFLPREAARSFPAPPSFRRDSPAMQEFDIVVVADVRPHAAHATLASTIVEGCVHHGLAVGLHDAEDPAHPPRPGHQLTDSLLQFVHDERVRLVHEGVSLRTRLVLVVGPAVLQLANLTRTAWEIDESWIVAPTTSSDDGEGVQEPPVIPDECRRIADARFGVPSLWIDGAPAELPELAARAARPHPVEGR